jgi:hypothetical protein
MRMLLRAMHLPPVPKEHANERYLHYKDKMIEPICLFMNLSVFMLLSLSIKLNWCYNDGEGRFWMVEDPETECRWNLAFPAAGSQNIAKWGVHLFGMGVWILIVLVYPVVMLWKINRLERSGRLEDEHELSKYGTLYADFNVQGWRVYFRFVQFSMCDVVLSSLEPLLQRSPKDGKVYEPYVMNSVFIGFRFVYMLVVMFYGPYKLKGPMAIDLFGQFVLIGLVGFTIVLDLNEGSLDPDDGATVEAPAWMQAGAVANVVLMVLFTAIELWPLVELVREVYLPKLRRKPATKQVESELAAPVAPPSAPPAAPTPLLALSTVELAQRPGASVPATPPPPAQGAGAAVHRVNDLVEVRLRMELEEALLFVVGNKDTVNLMSWM